MLEFGNQYIRFFKDKGQILEGDITISGITKANPGVVTATAHGYSNGDFVILSSVSGMTQVNSKTYKVANKATNTFELNDVDGNAVDTSGYSTYTSGGVANKIYQITTNYLTAELFDIKVAQSADVMYITHPNHEVSKLSRTGHTSWTLSEVDFAETGPYLSANTTATTLTPASSGTGFFVSNKGHIITNNHVIEACHVVKVNYQGNIKSGKVLATDRTSDLSLLQTDIEPKDIFNISNEDAKLLEEIYVAGYPFGKALSSSIKVTKGVVSALSGLDDNFSKLQIDAALQPGNRRGSYYR